MQQKYVLRGFKICNPGSVCLYFKKTTNSLYSKYFMVTDGKIKKETP
jgi:hypothetical protein